MIVFNIIENIDLSGKIIMPFCTHEGSGMGNSIKDICRICPNAKVGKGLAIRGSYADKSEKEIEKWIKE